MNITREQEEIKKEFQLERVILFSDAVFAIVVTIMVIDIKLPEDARNLANPEIPHEFFKLMIKLMAYAASFFIVGNFWMRHLKIFGFLRDYNKSLIIYNLLFLFCVSLFPFAVSLITGSFKMHSPIFVYGINIYIGVILSTIMSQTLLMRYLIVNRSTLCIHNDEMERVLEWKAQRVNLILLPLIGLVVLALNYFQMQAVYSLYAAALIGIINARARRYYYPKHKSA